MASTPRGRTPLGGRTSVNLPRSTEQELRVVAGRFGQRRFGTIVRVAIRRLMDQSPTLVEHRLAARRPLSVESHLVTIYLGEDLRAELDVYVATVDAQLAEVIRLACDLLLAELATARLDGAEIDLTDAVTQDVYRGAEPNSYIIRRHQERQTAGQQDGTRNSRFPARR